MAKHVIPALPTPNNIIHEVAYRGRRICATDDKRCIGGNGEHKDKWGFSPSVGYVVLDEFDENVFPVGMHWFHTPDDAASAIEMLDTILPTIKKGQEATGLMYEYSLMRAYRREFWQTYHCIAKMQRAVDTAAQMEDDATNDVRTALHFLRQQVAQGTGRGLE